MSLIHRWSTNPSPRRCSFVIFLCLPYAKSRFQISYKQILTRSVILFIMCFEDLLLYQKSLQTVHVLNAVWADLSRNSSSLFHSEPTQTAQRLQAASVWSLIDSQVLWLKQDVDWNLSWARATNKASPCSYSSLQPGGSIPHVTSKIEPAKSCFTSSNLAF